MRDYSVAKSATVRAARPDSLDYARDRLFAAQKRLAQDDNQTAPLPNHQTDLPCLIVSIYALVLTRDWIGSGATWLSRHVAGFVSLVSYEC